MRGGSFTIPTFYKTKNKMCIFTRYLLLNGANFLNPNGLFFKSFSSFLSRFDFDSPHFDFAQ